MPPKSKTATSTSPRSDLRLSEYARKFTFPKGQIKKTVWPRVEAKGKELGLGFDWWQSQLGTVCLGYDENGKYVATVGGIGMSIPRQVGKTYFVLAMLVILCILFPGLQVVWTAHHLRTSTKTFTSLRGICRRKKIAPHIRAMRSANGEQQVEFFNGSMIMFGARSQGFGRGFDEIDIEVFDEAQILDTKALEDMIAATNQARHEHGALLFFMGTPPRPTDPSEAFSQRRAEAHAGEAEDAIWLEIGADPKSDPLDRSQWPLMNPSFPERTPLESMLRLMKNLKDEDSWNREGRGIWDAIGSSSAIDTIVWHDDADPASMAIDHLALGIQVSPDRSIATVGLGGQRADGMWHVEVDEQRNGTSWIVDHVVARCAKNNIRAVVIDAQSQAASLADELEKRKVKVTLIGTKDVAASAGLLYDKAMGTPSGTDADGNEVPAEPTTLRHIDQPILNASNGAATKKDVMGGKAWVWETKHTALDITPTQAVSLALWGATNTNVKKPTRKRTGTGRRVVTYG
jgi:hypothetical protein